MHHMQQTSIICYHQIKDTLNPRQKTIYDTLVQHGPSTDREVTRTLCFIDPNSVRPRRNELVRLGLVEEVERRKCGITNRLAISWGAIPCLN